MAPEGGVVPVHTPPKVDEHGLLVAPSALRAHDVAVVRVHVHPPASLQLVQQRKHLLPPELRLARNEPVDDHIHVPTAPPSRVKSRCQTAPLQRVVGTELRLRLSVEGLHLDDVRAVS